MNIYLTEIENTNIAGPRIKAFSLRQAKRIAESYSTSIGKLIVIGKFVEEIEHTIEFEINMN